jgi:pimeloyl-ACP methyl ester carboxylesterase
MKKNAKIPLIKNKKFKMLTQELPKKNFPPFIPSQADQLTEIEAINLINQIQRQPLLTPLNSEAIFTSFVQQGEDKTPILLLHGFDSSLLEFRQLLPLLAQHRETWALDLLGFGFTDRLDNLEINANSIKIHLHSFWEKYIKQPVILIGTSMGGATAIDFTLTYPNLVKKLVLSGSAGLANPPLMGKLMFPPFDSLATKFLGSDKVRQGIVNRCYYNQELADINATICGSLHLKMNNWDKSLISFTKGGGYGNFAKYLPQIEQETLILWGEYDKILGTKDAPKFNKLIKNSKLIWLKDCGHFPQIEKVQELSKAILNFI